MATQNQSKAQNTSKAAGSYKSSGFVASKPTTTKKSISLLDILLGKK